MDIRSATAQDASGIVALHRSANPYGGWYRDPFQKLGPAKYEDLTPLERYFHGGFWMDLSLFRRHFHEYQTRGFPILVAEKAGKIVGECEVWRDDEPAPFGRYAEIVMLGAGSPPDAEVEQELVLRAAERVRKLGYPALDLSPLHGGSDRVVDLGFRAIWDTRTYEADAKAISKPEVEFTTKFLAGEYGDLGLFLALDHREPARWRFETLAALWPAARVAGLQDATKVTAVAVETESQRFAVLAARREWLDPAPAELDVWLDPSNLTDDVRTREAYQVGAEIARRLGTKRLRAYGPPHAARTLPELGFSGGNEPDPWLRWSF
jgi:hypothetical protein